jgi:hypothetical protein
MKVYETFNNQQEFTQAVTKLLVAHSMVGNQIRKLNDREKVKDTQVGQQVYALCRSLKLRAPEGDQSKNKDSLGRIAIAFLPSYFATRILILEKLQDQFPSTTPIELQSPILGPIAQLMGQRSSFLNYSKEFSRAMPGKEVKEGEEERWMEISVAGFQRDSVSQQAWESYLESTRGGKTPAQALMTSLLPYVNEAREAGFMTE